MLMKRLACTLLSGFLIMGTVVAVASAPASAATQQSILLTAEGATGHLVSLSATFVVTATTTNFRPIQGLSIKVEDGGGAGNVVCIGVTNSQGAAVCQGTASDDILLILSFLVTGYDAVFAGNGAYFPATAHGRITPAVP
jgi:hypothetical protein